jgi:hypothetical protein
MEGDGMIGFRPQQQRRVAIRNDQGAKVGYLTSANGRQIYQSLDGKNVAYIKAWKYGPPSRQGAQGGNQIAERGPDWWTD